MRGRCTVHTSCRLPESKFPASETTSLEQLKKKRHTVQSRMTMSTNPSSKLTTSRCLVAIMIFFIHSCSDGVKMKVTQSPALVCDRGGGNGSRAYRLAIRGRSENACRVLHLPQHRTPGPMPRTRASKRPRSQPR